MKTPPAPKPKTCKDCRKENVTTRRPAPFPGPRCRTHHVARRRTTRANAHTRRIETTYGLSFDDYWRLHRLQGGRCYICQRATGKTKHLAVDHEHGRPGCTHPAERGCHLCVRALLCGPCNQTLGRLGVVALRRAIEVLTYPPAQRMLLCT